jgi:hypothetical protein
MEGMKDEGKRDLGLFHASSFLDRWHPRFVKMGKIAGPKTPL